MRLLCLPLLLLAVMNLQLKISYSSISQLLQLYFHNQTNQLYIDIGSSDSIMEQASTSLTTWRGINVQANLTRHQNHVASSKRALKLHYAVRKQDGKTIRMGSYLGLTGRIINSNDPILPIIQLGQLCQIYCFKQLKLLSISLQARAAEILNSNNWNNSLCRADIISLPKGQSRATHQQLLKNLGYQLANQTADTLLFVQTTKKTVYEAIVVQGSKKSQSQRWVQWKLIASQLLYTFPALKQKKNRFDDIFQVAIAYDSMIDLRQKFSRPKPFLLIQYNPLKSKVLVDKGIKAIRVQAQRQELLVLKKQQQEEDQRVSVLVLNHWQQRMVGVLGVEEQLMKLSQRQNDDCSTLFNGYFLRKKKVDIDPFLKAQ